MSLRRTPREKRTQLQYQVMPGYDPNAEVEILAQKGVITDLIRAIVLKGGVDQIEKDPDLQEAILESLHLLVQGKLWESVIKTAKHFSSDLKDKYELQQILLIEEYFTPRIKAWREMYAQKRLAEIIEALNEGVGTFDAKIAELCRARYLDSNFFQYLDKLMKAAEELREQKREQIREAGGEPDKSKGSETLYVLGHLKNRLLAEMKMTEDGKVDYIRTIAFLFKIPTPAQRKEVIRAAMKNIEGLSKLQNMAVELLKYRGAGDQWIGIRERAVLDEVIRVCTELDPIRTPPTVTYDNVPIFTSPPGSLEDVKPSKDAFISPYEVIPEALPTKAPINWGAADNIKDQAKTLRAYWEKNKPKKPEEARQLKPYEPDEVPPMQDVVPFFTVDEEHII